jgi:hypothetical protein
MEELVEIHEVAAFNFGTTFADSSSFGFGGDIDPVSIFKILSPRLSEQL